MSLPPTLGLWNTFHTTCLCLYYLSSHTQLFISPLCLFISHLHGDPLFVASYSLPKQLGLLLLLPDSGTGFPRQDRDLGSEQQVVVVGTTFLWTHVTPTCHASLACLVLHVDLFAPFAWPSFMPSSTLSPFLLPCYTPLSLCLYSLLFPKFFLACILAPHTCLCPYYLCLRLPCIYSFLHSFIYSHCLLLYIVVLPF